MNLKPSLFLIWSSVLAIPHHMVSGIRDSDSKRNYCFMDISHTIMSHRIMNRSWWGQGQSIQPRGLWILKAFQLPPILMWWTLLSHTDPCIEACIPVTLLVRMPSGFRISAFEGKGVRQQLAFLLLLPGYVVSNLLYRPLLSWCIVQHRCTTMGPTCHGLKSLQLGTIIFPFITDLPHEQSSHWLLLQTFTGLKKGSPSPGFQDCLCVTPKLELDL